MAIPRVRYNSKRKRRQGNRFKQGYYIPKNPDKYQQPLDQTMNSGPHPFMRSSWERKFAVWCDTSDDVEYWGCEVLNIPYYDTLKGKQRRYFPDFFVKMKNGRKMIIEIKPAKQCPQSDTPTNPVHINNRDKWESARKYADYSGSEFIIMTEKELGIK